ncbi:MAG: hypothetical protein JXB47_12285 [Anaerolineae bacterium]|nr:hypothetical protein [Anaerolineae bacterium]
MDKSLTPQNDPNDEDDHPAADWVVVAEALGMEHAEIMVSSLRAAGIPAWIERESAGAAIGLTLGPLGRIQVLVSPEYETQALDLLGGGRGEIDPDEYTKYALDEDENIIYLGGGENEDDEGKAEDE